MKTLLPYINKLGFLLMLLIFTNACDEPDYPDPNLNAPAAQTNLLIVNAAPGTTARVSLENQEINAGLPYTGIHNNGYFQTTGGQRLIGFEVPGNPVPLVGARQAFNANASYTIFLTDATTRPASGSDRGGVRTLVVPDNLEAPAAGKAGLRFLNLAPGASSMSYGLFNTLSVPAQSILPTSKTFTTKAGTTGTLNNLHLRSFREVSKTLTITNPDNTRETFTEPLTNFTSVDPGTYSLDARASAVGLPVATLPNVTLEPGKLYTIYLYGMNGDPNTPLRLGIIQHN
ncbi:DUF4397 domain-containing protein [Adhaeribacter soli]|uniref:DUF4397 domain-containing protein n=1 Tax=Adhaeribacter soli TaxID=2607655 RepID=A0A5N1IL58_9BACT|nr:DUF4397 domain-containing protein [Adhaeribacter soli]KAA9327424.1 DUF4397 domain-containing protein [Adhaeribacter soli]